jgi:predicted dehydrogenase
MKAGKHVFVEKPLTQNVKWAEKIVEAQKESGVIFEVGYMKRYDPGYNYALNEFKTMTDVRLIRMHNIASHHRERGEVCPKIKVPVPEELSKKAQAEQHKQTLEELGEETTPEEALAYGMLLGVTSHDINALRGIFGDPQAVLHTEIRHKGRFVTSLLDYENAVCVYEFGFTNHKWWDEQIFAYSPEKEVGVIFPSPFLKNAPTMTRIREGSDRTVDTLISDTYEEAFKLEWVNFVNCVENNQQPITTAEDGKRDVEIISAMIKNSRLKRPITI